MFKAWLHKFASVNKKLIDASCLKFASVNIKLMEASCLKRGFISLQV